MYYFSKQHLGLTNGIMITVSYNPKEYNGFKMSFYKIENAYGSLINDFKEFVNNGKFIDENGIEEKIKVVVDCGNGTGPNITIRFEANSEERLDEIQRNIKSRQESTFF